MVRQRATAVAVSALALGAVPQVSQAAPGDFWVGIFLIDSKAKCPAGTFKVSFYLDMEDMPPHGTFWSDVWNTITGTLVLTEWYNGFDSVWAGKFDNWQQVSGKYLNGSGYRFHWCRVDGESFKPLTHDLFNTKDAYSVLKLSGTCPPGSHDRGIYIDTEDDDPNNKKDGNISPNEVMENNAKLRFCQFRSDFLKPGAMEKFPEFKDNLGASVSYAVVHDFDGPQPSWVLNKKYVFFDDEDDDVETKYLEKPSGPLTMDPSTTFTSMVQRYKVGGDWGTFFEFAQVH
jgi:hypothetical protein